MSSNGTKLLSAMFTGSSVLLSHVVWFLSGFIASYYLPILLCLFDIIYIYTYVCKSQKRDGAMDLVLLSRDRRAVSDWIYRSKRDPFSLSFTFLP